MSRTCALGILRSSAILTLAFLSACAAPNAGSSPVTSQAPAHQSKGTRAPSDDASARSDQSSILAQPSSPAVRTPDSDDHADDSARQNSAPSTAAHSPKSSAAPSKVDPAKPQADAQLPLPSKSRKSSVPWVASHDPFDPSKEISLTGKWTGGRRLELHTDNVRRLTLDLYDLPVGAPTSGPWNLQIDRQGIEISGRRGKVIDLVRSTNGVWSVDTEKSPVRR